MRLHQLRVVGLALAFVFAIPNVVLAGSAIAGRVVDSTGSPLPGVTVEAAVAASSTSGVTDGHGRYLITGLAPGVYAVTFSLQGFSTVVHRGNSIEPDCLVSLDARMVLRAIGTGLIVTGSPFGGAPPARVTAAIAPKKGSGVPTPDQGRVFSGRPFFSGYFNDSCRGAAPTWLSGDLATFLGHHECLLVKAAPTRRGRVDQGRC